jgi:hypothetical protein
MRICSLADAYFVETLDTDIVIFPRSDQAVGPRRKQKYSICSSRSRRTINLQPITHGTCDMSMDGIRLLRSNSTSRKALRLIVVRDIVQSLGVLDGLHRCRRSSF